MWVNSHNVPKIFAYLLADGTRQSTKDFTPHTDNGSTQGIWSNGTTMWVTDRTDDKLYAYSHATMERSATEDFNTLSAAGNNTPTFVTGNGTTVWVGNYPDKKVYSYNMAVSTDATLSALTVSPKDIIGFDPDRSVYHVGLESTVTRATIHASATNNYAVVSATSTDVDAGMPGHQENLSSGENTVTFRITAQDGVTSKVYLVKVNRGVTDDYGWKASDDFDGLVAAGNVDPRGIAANSTTMWVVDDEDAKIYAYRKFDGTRDSARDIPLHSGNARPRGIWSNDTTIWVVDLQDIKVYAYRISDKSRQTSIEFNLDPANTAALGIYSDGTTMWINESIGGKLFAYLLADGTRQETEEFDLHTHNGTPGGIWSNGTTMWVTDQIDDKIYAYSHATKARTVAEDFDTLSAAGNNNPTHMTSDGTTVWTLDYTDKKIYSYNTGISSDATLSALTVSPKDIIGFDPGQQTYKVGLASTVTQATLTATAAHPLATLDITPADAVSGTTGHQVNLSAGRNAVTITVTAEDDTEKIYRVNINRGVTTPYGWKASDDLDGLIAAGQTLARGITSNDTTIWILDGVDDAIYAYRKSDGTRDSSKDFDTLTAAGNEEPTGITTYGATMWVADFTDNKLYAYNVTTKARDTSEEFATHADNDTPSGIWTDGTTLWVANNSSVDTEDRLYAYTVATGARDASKDFFTLDSADNNDPSGIWSDGVTMWVADWRQVKIFAYDMATKARDGTKDFNTISMIGSAANSRPYGIWSDGTTTWISDSDDIKVYSYNHPESTNADLKTLAVNDVEVSGFNPATTTYTLTVPDATREVTVSAEALQFKAEITSITPADADTRPGWPPSDHRRGQYACQIHRDRPERRYQDATR